MKIEIERCKDAIDAPLSLDEFAERYGLVMRVHEREHVPPGTGNRFYASFVRVEVKNGAMLRGEYGDGSTPETAIQNYSDLIRGKLLVYSAYGSDRREFYAHIS